MCVSELWQTGYHQINKIEIKRISQEDSLTFKASKRETTATVQVLINEKSITFHTASSIFTQEITVTDLSNIIDFIERKIK